MNAVIYRLSSSSSSWWYAFDKSSLEKCLTPLSLVMKMSKVGNGYFSLKKPLTLDSSDQLQKTLDTFTKNIAALKLLDCNVKDWDFVLFNLLLDKLDIKTKKSFEKEHTQTEMPTYNDLKTFVSDYASALARVKKSQIFKSNHNQFQKSASNNKLIKSHAATLGSEKVCNICRQSHYLNQCTEFIKLGLKELFQRFKELKLCNNCFRNHLVKNCSSKFNCRYCQQRHHSLLHFELVERSRVPGVQSAIPDNNLVSNHSAGTSSTVLASQTRTSQILLATAIVKVRDVVRKLHSCRCLLDPG